MARTTAYIYVNRHDVVRVGINMDLRLAIKLLAGDPQMQQFVVDEIKHAMRGKVEAYERRRAEEDDE